jgi:pimeloyl-ACP methyl ester carboxylesterase
MGKLNQRISLPDGRKLGFDEHGPSHGKPLFYFHGTPSSRVEFNQVRNEDLLEELNLRVIVPDRPGLGLSGFQPGRRFGDWPKDVISLADHLGFDRFAIVGYSGGGAYAAVCAFSIPERITKAGIVSGVGPFTEPALVDGIPQTNRDYFNLSHQKPWLSRMMIRMMGMMSHIAPGKIIANMMSTLPKADCNVMRLPEVQQTFLAMFKEALRQGPRGAQHDTFLMVTAWDFHPREIQIPVHIWHGEEDRNAPIAMGRYMANAIPGSQAKFYPGEGHISLFKRYAEEIFTTLVWV